MNDEVKLANILQTVRQEISRLGVHNTTTQEPATASYQSAANNEEDDNINAFAHAYTSALIAHKYGQYPAFVAGNARELLNLWYLAKAPLDSKSTIASVGRDDRRDQFNNDVGRKIAA